LKIFASSSQSLPYYINNSQRLLKTLSQSGGIMFHSATLNNASDYRANWLYRPVG